MQEVADNRDEHVRRLAAQQAQVPSQRFCLCNHSGRPPCSISTTPGGRHVTCCPKSAAAASEHPDSDPDFRRLLKIPTHPAAMVPRSPGHVRAQNVDAILVARSSMHRLLPGRRSRT